MNSFNKVTLILVLGLFSFNLRAQGNTSSIKSLYPARSFMWFDVAANINQGGDRFLYGPGIEAGVFFRVWATRPYHSNNAHQIQIGARGSYHNGLVDREVKNETGFEVSARFYTVQALLRYMSPATKDNLYSFIEAGYAYSIAQYNSDLPEELMRTLNYYPGNNDHLFKGSVGIGYVFEEFFRTYVGASVMANRSHVEGFGSLGFTVGL